MIKMSFTLLVPSNDCDDVIIPCSPRTIYFNSSAKARTKAVTQKFSVALVEQLNKVNHKGCSKWEVNDNVRDYVRGSLGLYPDGSWEKKTRNGKEQYDFSASGCGISGADVSDVMFID